MSFFIKGKQGNKNKKFASKYRQPAKKRKIQEDAKINDEDDHISSDSDEDVQSNGTVSEEDVETAQEKKIRLAKLYLEEIEKQEKERLENKESLNQHDDIIAKRLKDDYLKQKGKLRTTLADQLQGFDENNVVTLKCREHKSCVTTLAVSHDSKYAFSGSKCGNLVKWSLETRKKVGIVPFKKVTSSVNGVLTGHSHAITCICLSSDFKYMAVSDMSNDIQIWDPCDLTHRGTLRGHKNAVLGLVFKMQSHTLYSTGKDRSVKVWSVSEMAYVETMYGHQDAVGSIDAMIRERAITAGGYDGSIRVWKIEEESQLVYNATGCIDVVKLINEENFVSGGDDGCLNVWSALKKKPVAVATNAHGLDQSNGLPNWITALAALKNSDLLASGSYDGKVRLWKVSQNYRKIEMLFEVPLHGFVNSLEFSPDGDFLLAAVGREHRLGRWQVVRDAKASVVVIPLLKK